MLKTIALILILTFIFSFSVSADFQLLETNTEAETIYKSEKKELSLLQLSGYILLVEGLFAVNSLMAGYAPMPYGIIGIIISPLSLSDLNTPFTTFTTFSLFIGLCSYNIIYPLYNDTDPKELFWHNYAGWHIITVGAGIGALIDYFIASKKSHT